MKACIVIPAFNEVATIRALAEAVLAHCPRLAVVDDGSDDGTGDSLAGLPLTLIRHEENRGKAAALSSGFAWALAEGADAVITLDGDGQHRPQDIARLLAVAAAHPGALVVGARLVGREDSPRARQRANRIADFWIGWAAGRALPDSQSGFRAYPARLLEGLAPLHQTAIGFTFESEVLICAPRQGFELIAVPIPALYHQAGRRSHFRPISDITRIVVMVAAHLLRSRMYLAGLRRSLKETPRVIDPSPSMRVRSTATTYLVDGEVDASTESAP